MPIAHRGRTLVAVAAITASLLAPTAAARTAAATTAKVRACGLVGRFAGPLYDVRETKGSVPCKRVRQVVTKFFQTAAIRPAPGWVCFRGHGSAPWAASCSRGARVLVRVYPPT